VLENSLKICPNSLINLFNLGRICYYAKKYQKAEKYFKNLIEQKAFIFYPELEDIYPTIRFYPEDFCYSAYIDNLIEYLVFKNKKFLTVLNSIIISGAYFYLGKLKYELRDYKEAINYFEKSIKIFENNAFCYLYAGWSYLKISNKEKGIRYLEIAVKKMPYLILKADEIIDFNKKYKEKFIQYTLVSNILKKEALLKIIPKEKIELIEAWVKQEKWDKIIKFLHSKNIEEKIIFPYICEMLFKFKKEKIPYQLWQRCISIFLKKVNLFHYFYKEFFFWNEGKFDVVAILDKAKDEKWYKVYFYPNNDLAQYIIKNALYPKMLNHFKGFIDDFEKLYQSSNKLDLVITISSPHFLQRNLLEKTLRKISHLREKLNVFFIDSETFELYKVLWCCYDRCSPLCRIWY